MDSLRSSLRWIRRVFPLGVSAKPLVLMILLGSHFQPRSFFVLCHLLWVMDGVPLFNHYFLYKIWYILLWAYILY